MRFAVVGLCLFLSPSLRAHDSRGTIVIPPYNEVMESAGRLRPAYREFTNRQRIKPFPVRPETVQNLLGMPLGDSIKILPIPAVLPNEDYQRLQEGAMLRARTLVSFFADVIFNNSRTVRQSGILTEKQIAMIFATENFSYDLKLLRRIWKKRSVNDINVLYGPDVVRNQSGEFRVLEDNVGGLMGGIGDIAATHNAFFSTFGSDPKLESPLKEAIVQYLNPIPRSEWKDKVIVLYRTPSDDPERVKPDDEEEERIRETAKALDLNIVDISSLKTESDEYKKIVAGHYKKIVNFYSPFEISGNAVPLGILNAFAHGKFDLFVGPGIDAVGSKAMLPFVDRLSELYHGTKSVLPSQPTFWIESDQDLDSLDKDWVIKKVDGRQGNEVYLLNSINQKGLKALKTHISEWNSFLLLRRHSPLPMFIRQERVEPSYIPADNRGTWVAFNVDFRPHVFVIRGEPLKPAVWGRASWKIPGVLNNVSQTAMELIVTTPDLCERELMKPLK